MIAPFEAPLCKGIAFGREGKIIGPFGKASRQRFGTARPITAARRPFADASVAEEA